MKVRDFDDFRSPRRKPWLLLLVLLAAVLGLAYYFIFRGGGVPAGEEHSDDGTSDVNVAVGAGAGAPGVGSESAAVSPGRDAAPGRVSDVGGLLSRCRALEEKGDFAGARKNYLAALKEPLSPQARAQVEDVLGKLNVRLAMTPEPMAEKVEYVVKSGDSVGQIALKYGTTVDLVQVGNRLSNPNRIQVGDIFRILSGTFRIEVSKSRRDLVLYLNKQFFKRYHVGIGRYGKTPTGTFVITDKQKEPVWWRPDGKEIPYGRPENILGTRWMAIKATGDTPNVRGYGIHGTWDDSSIGKAESAGCIRMSNHDVEELFTLVPVKSAVTITE